jgi:NADPH:quinone reductase-like Zn-dependent oxidoreductase
MWVRMRFSLRRMPGLHVVALVGSKDFEYVRGLGAETVIDYHDGNFESSVSPVDVVIDTVGKYVEELK